MCTCMIAVSNRREVVLLDTLCPIHFDAAILMAAKVRKENLPEPDGLDLG